MGDDDVALTQWSSSEPKALQVQMLSWTDPHLVL